VYWPAARSFSTRTRNWPPSTLTISSSTPGTTFPNDSRMAGSYWGPGGMAIVSLPSCLAAAIARSHSCSQAAFGEPAPGAGALAPGAAGAASGWALPAPRDAGAAQPSAAARPTTSQTRQPPGRTPSLATARLRFSVGCLSLAAPLVDGVEAQGDAALLEL